MKNNIGMSAPNKISEDLQLLAEKRAAIADLERKSFMNDFARSSQCEAMVEAQLMYLKHKAIPSKMKENPPARTLTINPNVQRYCSPWIYDDANFRSMATEIVARELGRALGTEYSVEFEPATHAIKISW